MRLGKEGKASENLQKLMVGVARVGLDNRNHVALTVENSFQKPNLLLKRNPMKDRAAVAPSLRVVNNLGDLMDLRIATSLVVGILRAFPNPH